MAFNEPSGADTTLARPAVKRGTRDANGWFIDTVRGDGELPPKVTAQFLNSIVGNMRALALAAGIDLVARLTAHEAANPGTHDDTILTDAVKLIIPIPATATFSARAPVAADLTGKASGHRWVNGCDEWLLMPTAAAGSTPAGSEWKQVKGSVRIWNTGLSLGRVNISNRRIITTRNITDFCLLYFYFDGTRPESGVTPLSISAKEFVAGKFIYISDSQGASGDNNISVKIAYISPTVVRLDYVHQAGEDYGDFILIEGIY